jgi:hypothetical protein
MPDQMPHAATSAFSGTSTTTPTRRSLVRAAAWAAPAVIVAAAAPPAAAASTVPATGWDLDLELGDTYIVTNANSWSLYFSGARVTNLEAVEIPVGKLYLQISFTPDGSTTPLPLTPSTTASLPTFTRTNPDHMLYPTYTSNQPVPAGLPVALSDGVWLTTPATGRPSGTFHLLPSVLGVTAVWNIWSIRTP